MNCLGDDHLAEALRDGERHEHGLGGGRAAVVQAGVRNVQTRELRHQRLIFERRLQRTLAGLRLIGRVGGVKLAAARKVVDGRRDEMIVCAATQKADLLVCSLIQRQSAR